MAAKATAILDLAGAVADDPALLTHTMRGQDVVVSTLGIGLFISTISNTQQEALLNLVVAANYLREQSERVVSAFDITLPREL